MRFDMRDTPLIVARQRQQSVEYLRFLLQAGADLNLNPDTSTQPARASGTLVPRLDCKYAL